MAKKIEDVKFDLLNKEKVDCTEIQGKLGDLYSNLMDIVEEIYKLREKPMKKTALITEHVILRLEELNLKGKP